MVYRAPAPSGAADKPENRFDFQLWNDETIYSIPKLAYIKPDLLRKITGQELTSGILGLIEEYNPGVTAKLEDSEQLGGIISAWSEESGISVGESSGSSTSSKASTVEPSTGTSSSSDSDSQTSEHRD